MRECLGRIRGREKGEGELVIDRGLSKRGWIVSRIDGIFEGLIIRDIYVIILSWSGLITKELLYYRN